MSIIDKTILSKDQPQNTNVLWAKPKDGGGIELNAFNNGKWEKAGGESTQEPTVVEMGDLVMSLYNVEVDASIKSNSDDDDPEGAPYTLTGSLTVGGPYEMSYEQPLMPYDDFVELLHSGKPVDLLSSDKKKTYHITSYEVLDQKDWYYYDHYDYQKKSIAVGVIAAPDSPDYSKEDKDNWTGAVHYAISKKKYIPTIQLVATVNDIEEFPHATSTYKINLRWWDDKYPMLHTLSGKVDGKNDMIYYKGNVPDEGLSFQYLEGSPIFIQLDENNESTVNPETVWKAFCTHPVYFNNYYGEESLRATGAVMGQVMCHDVRGVNNEIVICTYYYTDAPTEGKYHLECVQRVLQGSDGQEPGENPSILGVTSLTYADLKSTRDSSNLVPGGVYRITDYQCTTISADTQSANHQFDILVTALDANKLNESARAVRHNGDENLPDATDGTAYFAGSKLEAWKIWYCLDNDTSRFAWADDTNGKGVIYRMIDEFDNDIPYDFKNIQFKRYKITSCLTSSLVGLYYGINNLSYTTTKYDDTRATVSMLTVDPNDSTWVYTFGIGTDYSKEGKDLNVRIPYWHDTDSIQKLNNIFFDTGVASNSTTNRNVSFGCGCRNCSIGSNFSSITIGEVAVDLYICFNNCAISIGNNCKQITIGNNSSQLSFGNKCYYISLGAHCTDTSFGNMCIRNSCGNYFCGNFLGNRVQDNSFGNYVRWNSFSTHVMNNSFGNEIRWNTFGTNCTHLIFGVDSSETKLNAFYENNRIDEGVSYIRSHKAGTDSSRLQYYHITSGMSFSKDSPYVLDAEMGRTYETTVAKNSKGEVVEYCEADLINTK